MQRHNTSDVLKPRKNTLHWKFSMVLSLECRSIRGYSEGILMLTLHMTGYGFSQRRCRGAVEWFIFKYLPRHHITLEVLHRGLKKEGVIGWCDIDGKTYKPRQFLIELQTGMDPDSYLTTLFHELWHVYQFVKGDLRVKSSKPYYKGICIEGVDYQDLEHEKEAYSMESKLFNEYITSLTT